MIPLPFQVEFDEDLMILIFITSAVMGGESSKSASNAPSSPSKAPVENSDLADAQDSCNLDETDISDGKSHDGSKDDGLGCSEASEVNVSSSGIHTPDTSDPETGEHTEPNMLVVMARDS